MTIQMNLHPQYITDVNGNKISVILPIEEFNNLIKHDDLSHMTSQVVDGLNSHIIEQSHKEIFKELKTKYA